MDGVGDAARDSVDVVVDGERITAVVAHGAAWPEPGAVGPNTVAPAIIDGTGSTLLPGLIDVHAHYTFDPTEGSIATIARRSDAEIVLAAAGHAARALRAGVTTARGAPLLSPDLRPTISAGDVLRGPVGSTGVRRAIESFRPVLGVHGHIHESGGERRIGDTVCVNAGSESSTGILRGYLVDLGPNGVERTLRVEG